MTSHSKETDSDIAVVEKTVAGLLDRPASAGHSESGPRGSAED